MANLIVILIIIALLCFSIKSLSKNKEQGTGCCGCSAKGDCSKKSCN